MGLKSFLLALSQEDLITQMQIECFWVFNKFAHLNAANAAIVDLTTTLGVDTENLFTLVVVNDRVVRQ